MGNVIADFCQPTGDHYARPFVKWAGGKGRLISQINSRLPKTINDDVDTYVEPFVGGGAIFFHISNNYKIKNRIINDSNKNLIISYISIRDNCEELIASLSELEKRYLSASLENKENIYYKERNIYNSLSKKNNADKIDIASKFIFLNKTCYNGLYRSNKNGDFNVPHGSHSSYSICDKRNLRNVSKNLLDVKITNLDFLDFFNNIEKSKLLMYVDPPYTVAHNNNGFIEYNEKIFSFDNQKELSKQLSSIAQKNNKIIVSNAVHTNIYHLYHDEAGFICDIAYRASVIGSERKSRIQTSEYIFTSYPKTEYRLKEVDLFGNN